MERISLRTVALCLSLLTPLAGVAGEFDCDHPPKGEGGDWARDYKRWCEDCGGTYLDKTQGCDAGDHWRGGQAADPAANAARRRAAEERRQRDEEEWQAEQERAEQRRQQEQEAKRRAEEGERRREEALRSIKGISENELGIRGAGEALQPKGMTEPLPVRELHAGAKSAQKPVCQWGDQPPSVVDLRCLGLDPARPVAVDPHVVRGQERVFPAQIDPETFKNVDYNQGFAALMRFDVASAAEAITRFEAARKARPHDPLVRNALLLARDIHRGRVQKEQSNQREAAFLNLQSYAALMSGDADRAGDFAAQALKREPTNSTSGFLASFARSAAGRGAADPVRADAYRLVANALYSLRRNEPQAAVATLTTARRSRPDDVFIGALLDQVSKLPGAQPAAGGEKSRVKH